MIYTDIIELNDLNWSYTYGRYIGRNLIYISAFIIKLYNQVMVEVSKVRIREKHDAVIKMKEFSVKSEAATVS